MPKFYLVAQYIDIRGKVLYRFALPMEDDDDDAYDAAITEADGLVPNGHRLCSTYALCYR